MHSTTNKMSLTSRPVSSRLSIKTLRTTLKESQGSMNTPACSLLPRSPFPLPLLAVTFKKMSLKLNGNIHISLQILMKSVTAAKMGKHGTEIVDMNQSFDYDTVLQSLPDEHNLNIPHLTPPSF